MPKRTINEIYDLIKQKYDMAYKDYIKLHEENNKTMIKSDIKQFQDYTINVILEHKMKAYCECYLDIICLIESSHILNDKSELTLEQQIKYDNVIKTINDNCFSIWAKDFLIEQIVELVGVLK